MTEWDVFQDDKNDSYFIPMAPMRQFISHEKGFVSFEIRMYFDPKETIPDLQGREGHRFLQKGLDIEKAILVEIDAD